MLPLITNNSFKEDPIKPNKFEGRFLFNFFKIIKDGVK